MNKAKKITIVSLLAASVVSLCLGIGLYNGLPKMTETANTEERVVETDKVYDNEGNALNGGTVYAMPVNMMFAPKANLLGAGNGESGTEVISAMISATITPNNAANKNVDWTVEFVNAESEWAQGKEVADYMTVTPQQDGSLIATVSCFQAFGEQIKLTATSRDNPEAFASCTVDFKQQFTGIELTVAQEGKTPTVNNGSKTGTIYADFVNEKPLVVGYTYLKSDVYTVALADEEITAPTAEIEYKAALNTALGNINANAAKLPVITSGTMNYSLSDLFDKAYISEFTAEETNNIVTALSNNKSGAVILKFYDEEGEEITKYTLSLDVTAIKNQLRVTGLSLSNNTLVFGENKTYTITYRRAGMTTGLALFEVGSEYGLSKLDGGSYPESYKAGTSVTVSNLKTSFSCSGSGGIYHSGSGSGSASYKFNGWYWDSAKTKPFDGTIPAGMIGDIVLYADITSVWTHNY